MEYNPTKLRPAELVQMLNSFPHFGTVTDNTKIFRHRQQAGFRISADGKTVNLFKYLAWLVDERQRSMQEPGPGDYDAAKEAAHARNAAMSQVILASSLPWSIRSVTMRTVMASVCFVKATFR